MNDNIVKKLSLPLNYLNNNETYEIELLQDRIYTLKELLTVIYNFYNTNLSDDELLFVNNLYDRHLNLINNKSKIN